MKQMLSASPRLLIGAVLMLIVSACGTAPQPVTVSVSVTGDGTGTVTSVPEGIEVSSGDVAGTLELPPGTEITLTATADEGSYFGGWDGVCEGEGATCTVTINEDTEVTATFTLDPYTLSVSVVAGGASAGSVTSSPAGIDTAVGNLSAEFGANSVVTLTAAATAGAFSGWVGGGCDDVKVPVCEVTMDAEKDVIATFNDIQVQVVRVAAGGDDAVEFLGDSWAGTEDRDPPQWFEGWVWVNASFLDLGWAPLHNLTETGFRFSGVSVPAGAVVTSAVLQVTAAEPEFWEDENKEFPTTGDLTLTIEGELSPDGVGFVQPDKYETSFDITLRPRTEANVTWSITSAWVAGQVHEAPNAAGVLQEIIDQPGWSSGNAVLLFLKDLTLDAEEESYRRVHSFESGAPETRHPTLFIEYALMPPIP